MLSGRGLCDELISRPEESYRLWCVVVCDLETTAIYICIYMCVCVCIYIYMPEEQHLKPNVKMCLRK